MLFIRLVDMVDVITVHDKMSNFTFADNRTIERVSLYVSMSLSILSLTGSGGV